MPRDSVLIFFVAMTGRADSSALVWNILDFYPLPSRFLKKKSDFTTTKRKNTAGKTT